jgi:predicted nuclease of predicted toxin-antitoxin system
MKAMNFYADENFPLRTVEELRRLGHDVLTTFEDGRANQAIPDEEILVRAVELKRAVLTLNRKDFRKLHEADSNHFGIIICTEDPDRAGQAKRISEKVEEFEDLRGQLIRIYRPAK